MKQQVIIPHFLRNESIRNYIPQAVKIQKGDTIRWINTDNESHHLYFIKIDPDPTNIEVMDEKLYLNFPGCRSIHFSGNSYRIVYRILDGHEGEILILHIGHRSSSYEDLARIIDKGSSDVILF